MNRYSKISIYLGYTVSLTLTIFGILIVSGLLQPSIPVQMRIMFGIVIVLWGVYRFTLTRTKIRQQSEEE